MWFIGALVACVLMAVMGAFAMVGSRNMEGEKYEQLAAYGGFGLYVAAALMLVAAFVKLLA